MAHLSEDKTDIEIKEKKMFVTRTIVEEFDPEEFLRNIHQMEQKKQFMTESLEAHEKMLEEWTACKAEAMEIRQAEMEEARKLREKVMAEQNDKDNDSKGK
jgi:hypothetical protein